MHPSNMALQALRKMLLSRMPVMAAASGVRLPGKQITQQILHSSQIRTLGVYSKRHSAVSASAQQAASELNKGKLVTVLPSGAHTARLIFDNDVSYDMNYIWLRDNCQCEKCLHPQSRQKLVDTAALNLDLQPARMSVDSEGRLNVGWQEQNGQQHDSVYESKWLQKYGRSFMLDSFERKHAEASRMLPPLQLWDRTSIWANVPQVSYNEFMSNDSGLFHWLDMIYKYGVVLIRGAPTERTEIINIVNRFAYVKSTIWGQTFDVVCEPVQSDPSHLAYTGRYLEHHTDMNYREKSPGLQLLHCLKAMDHSDQDYGGKSFFADGFMVANWLREENPAAFHILSSTPVNFQIQSHNMHYSQHWPIICVNKDGDLEEIHYNNRTMGPLQVPTHLVQPFYHALKTFAEKLRNPSSEWCFHLQPGDVVAFNNRRVLHGRTEFDASKVSRHLIGCYADIDEVFTRYLSMVFQKRN